MGWEEEFAARISSNLGLGVNHGDSCWAVTSTVLALDFAHGFSNIAQSGIEGGIEHKVKELESAFIKCNDSLFCRNLLSGGYDASGPNAEAPEGIDPWENCAKHCADAVANRPKAEKPQEQPSPIIVGTVSGATGLALGASAMAVTAYERRRAKRERLSVAYLYLVELCSCIIQPGTNMQNMQKAA